MLTNFKRVLKILFLFMCICVCLCEGIPYVCRCSWRPIEGVESPGAGVAGTCELFDRDPRN